MKLFAEAGLEARIVQIADEKADHRQSCIC
jgi:hypothetical protein